MVCCLWEVPMAKRNLRIVKRTPIAVAICESCNMQFHSKQPVEDNAEIDLKIQFSKHKCTPLDASQNAAPDCARGYR
jgi:hypothetical protein